MGTIKEGFLGGFSGKVGNVVGATWKDVHYIRSLPVNAKDPKTKEQVKQRSKFTVTMEFLKTITPFLRVGFEKEATGRTTAFNAAMSYNMKNAVNVHDRETVLDYPKVLVARGPVTPAREACAEIIQGELRIRWNPSIEGNASPQNMAMLVAYNPAKQQSVYDLNGGKRAGANASLEMLPGWEGNTIHVYLAFKTSSGANVSDSIYVGEYPV